MNLTTIEGATNFLCALDIAGTIAAGTVIETTADLSEGELALVNEKNVVLDATSGATATAVKFATKRKGVLRYSDLITKGNINFYSGKSYVAATTQVSYVGYNGTTGDMDSATATDYSIKVIDISGERLFPNKDMLQFGYYTSTAATQENVAVGLYANLLANNNYGEPFVDISLINNGADTVYATGHTVKVSKGSKTIIISHASSVVAPTAGTYYRFGGAGDTYPVYKLVSFTTSGNVITGILAHAYQGTTANLLTASSLVYTLATATKWGIKVAAVSRSYFKPGVSANLIFAFDLGITGFSTATVTNSTASTAGSGTYKQMAELEWYHEGHVGSVHRDSGILDEYSMSYMVTSTGTYEQLNIGFFDAGHHTAIGQAPKSMKHLIVAFANDLTTGDTADTAILAMDAFAAASNGFAASGISA